MAIHGDRYDSRVANGWVLAHSNAWSSDGVGETSDAGRVARPIQTDSSPICLQAVDTQRGRLSASLGPPIQIRGGEPISQTVPEPVRRQTGGSFHKPCGGRSTETVRS
jgi:hypothetical protein